MVAEALAPPHSLRTLRIGVLLALVITAIDVAGMIALGLSNAPVEVNVITTVLAIVTVVGGVWAWRGVAWGVWVAVVSRALSALSVVPILLVPEAPKEAIPMSVVVLALTLVAIVLLLVGLARRSRSS